MVVSDDARSGRRVQEDHQHERHDDDEQNAYQVDFQHQISFLLLVEVTGHIHSISLSGSLCENNKGIRERRRRRRRRRFLAVPLSLSLRQRCQFPSTLVLQLTQKMHADDYTKEPQMSFPWSTLRFIR